MKSDAYPKRQLAAEYIYINSLVDHHIWSIIKILPATLSEPSSMDRGPRTGATEAVSHSDLDIVQGVGRIKGANHKIFFINF